MSSTSVAPAFDEQILRAINLVRVRRFALAAATVARLPDVRHSHVTCVLTEIEREHVHNAIVALELLQDVYRPAPRPRLLLVVDDPGKSLA